MPGIYPATPRPRPTVSRSEGGNTPLLLTVRCGTRSGGGAERVDDPVEGGAGTHHGGGWGGVGGVVPADVDRAALHVEHLLGDRRLGVLQGAGRRREQLGHAGVDRLRGALLGPV